MTDELERLLEEEDEESQVPQVFSAGAGGFWRKREMGKAPAAAVLQESGEKGAVDGPPLRGGLEEGSAVKAAAEAAPLLEAGGRSYAPEGARDLYRTLLETRRAAEYRPPQRGERVKLVKEPAPEAGRLDAAGLDRLFQRDARRYDGGFTWQ